MPVDASATHDADPSRDAADPGPMRIALITETYPPEVNGVAMTLSRLVNLLADRGHALQVIRPRQHRHDHGATDDRRHPGVQEITVAGLPLPGYAGLKFGLPTLGLLHRAWSDQRPDVVHFATEGPLGYAALRTARRLGIGACSSFHTNFHQYSRHYGLSLFKQLGYLYMRRIHNAADATLVPSTDQKRQLEADGFQRVEVLSRGVDAQLFSPEHRDPELRASWGAGEDDPVFAYVGRLAGEKNVPLVIQAFGRIAERTPNAKFVLVGDGPLGPMFQRDHPEYHFAGMQRGPDLARHYASADVFLFASTTETFGNVVTEAMASGLAVVTYAYAAGREHIRTDVNGLLAPFNDENAFLHLAEQLAADRPRQRRLGAAARETALAITWENIAEQFESTLRRIAEQAKRA